MSWERLFFLIINTIVVVITTTTTDIILKQAKPNRAVLPALATSYSDSSLLDKVTTPAPMAPQGAVIIADASPARMQW